MAIIVQITSGPFAGRKTYLRSGQELRIGRTEWADFSVPHDSAMSEVHFSLQYDAYTCRLRNLSTRDGTLLNGKKVNDAVVQHGDKITAGQTSFSIQIEGAVLSTGMEISAAALAGAAAAAAVVESGGSSGYKKVEPPLAFEVCKKFRLDRDAAKLLNPKFSCREFFELLVSKQLFPDALRFMAHSLPKREAVWWSCIAVRQLRAELLSGAEATAVAAAEAWATDPKEEKRRAAMSAAEAAKYEKPGGWAAAAAAWTGGSLAPPEYPVVPPGDALTAQATVAAITNSVVSGEPKQIRSRFKLACDLGGLVADGLNEWPQAEAK